MSEDKTHDQEIKRTPEAEALGDAQCNILGLQSLLRVIQDSAEFTTMRAARQEKAERVLEDIENSLEIAITRCSDIANDIEDIQSRLLFPDSERPTA